MSRLLSLYNSMSKANVSLFHWAIDEQKALTMEMANKYCIFVDFSAITSEADELCVIAHEGGHIATGATHSVHSPCDLIERHEAAANHWAIKKLTPLGELMKALKDGNTDIWDLAEHFGVTEDFMHMAIEYYTVNKGVIFNEDYED